MNRAGKVGLRRIRELERVVLNVFRDISKSSWGVFYEIARGVCPDGDTTKACSSWPLFFLLRRRLLQYIPVYSTRSHSLYYNKVVGNHSAPPKVCCSNDADESCMLKKHIQ